MEVEEIMRLPNQFSSGCSIGSAVMVWMIGSMTCKMGSVRDITIILCIKISYFEYQAIALDCGKCYCMDYLADLNLVVFTV